LISGPIASSGGFTYFSSSLEGKRKTKLNPKTKTIKILKIIIIFIINPEAYPNPVPR